MAKLHCPSSRTPLDCQVCYIQLTSMPPDSQLDRTRAAAAAAAAVTTEHSSTQYKETPQKSVAPDWGQVANVTKGVVLKASRSQGREAAVILAPVVFNHVHVYPFTRWLFNCAHTARALERET